MRGSSAMPQIGQFPGSSRTICGCIGQTYSVFETGATGATGSSAIPHFGHDPGWSCRISGCIGQVYRGPPAAAGMGALLFAGSSSAPVRQDTVRIVFEFLETAQAAEMVGRALVVERSLLVAGSTCIPHTGSVTLLIMMEGFRFRMRFFHHFFVLFGSHARTRPHRCLFCLTRVPNGEPTKPFPIFLGPRSPKSRHASQRNAVSNH